EPGWILFVLLGVAPLGVALLAWRTHRCAPLLTVGVGAALLIWMTVEIAMIGYAHDPPLQPIYIGLGLAIAVVGIAWLRQTSSPFGKRPAARR
ncbi:MAG: hypothetical protein M3O36_19175, partial [Myxococcota bacterium]|nr:hypothetical protein [Myxococcota bacterium]